LEVVDHVHSHCKGEEYVAEQLAVGLDLVTVI